MTQAEKQILQDIVNGLDNLAVAVDSLESALIHRGQLRMGEIENYSPQHVHTVANKLAGLRHAVRNLPTRG
jgi:hypothetical protein